MKPFPRYAFAVGGFLNSRPALGAELQNLITVHGNPVISSKPAGFGISTIWNALRML